MWVENFAAVSRASFLAHSRALSFHEVERCFGRAGIPDRLRVRSDRPRPGIPAVSDTSTRGLPSAATRSPSSSQIKIRGTSADHTPPSPTSQPPNDPQIAESVPRASPSSDVARREFHGLPRIHGTARRSRPRDHHLSANEPADWHATRWPRIIEPFVPRAASRRRRLRSAGAVWSPSGHTGRAAANDEESFAMWRTR